MIGFPEMQKFTLIYDEEKGNASHIMWFQSMEEPQTAFPVINPVKIKEDYNPTVSEELLRPLGEMQPEDTFVLVTVTVPKEIENMSINLKAPIIINMRNNKAAQIIVEDDLPVRYKIYDLLKKRKEKAGE